MTPERSKPLIDFLNAPPLPVQSHLDGRVSLRELRALVAVCETGSFRAAAERLSYTQSAISHQIAVLETALGTPLFLRPGGRAQIHLTDAGRGVYRHARRALIAVETMAVEARQLASSDTSRIRVGAYGPATAELLPSALRTFADERPGTEVSISESSESAELVGAIARDELDIAFALNPEPDERVAAIPLIEDPWVILTPRDAPLTTDPHSGLDVLDGAPLVAWRLSWRSQADLENGLARRGVAPRIVYRTDDNLTLQRLVAEGLGHACVGLLAARRAADPRLTWIRPREELVRRQIALCYPVNREVPAAVLALVDALRAQAGAMGRSPLTAAPAERTRADTP